MLLSHLREGGDYQPHPVERRKGSDGSLAGLLVTEPGGNTGPSEARSPKRAVLFSVLPLPALLRRGETQRQGRQHRVGLGRRAGALASRSPSQAAATGIASLRGTQASVTRSLFSPLRRVGEKQPQGLDTRWPPPPPEHRSRQPHLLHMAPVSGGGRRPKAGRTTLRLSSPAVPAPRGCWEM